MLTLSGKLELSRFFPHTLLVCFIQSLLLFSFQGSLFRTAFLACLAIIQQVKPLCQYLFSTFFQLFFVLLKLHRHFLGFLLYCVRFDVIFHKNARLPLIFTRFFRFYALSSFFLKRKFDIHTQMRYTIVRKWAFLIGEAYSNTNKSICQVFFGDFYYENKDFCSQRRIRLRT